MTRTAGSVLAAFAHPDDAELWAGATLTLHARHAAATDPVPHHDDVRDAEARKGSAALGADLCQIPWLVRQPADGQLTEESWRGQSARLHAA